MQETKGLLNDIKQHHKLTIKVSSNANNVLPASVLRKLLKPHRTAYYFFIFVNSGTSTHKIDLQNTTVSDGQLLFVLPNQIHTPPPKKDDLEYFKLSFDQNCLALLPQQFPFLINPFNRQTITFSNTAKQRVKAVFEILDQLLHSNKKQKDTAIILAHLNTLLTEFNNAYFKHIGQSSKSNPKLSKYIEFKLMVETHLTRQPSINTIAGKLALTTSNLYGIVKEFSGVSPKEFITTRLMLEAQRKLHYSNLSVKELAYELGFNDPDYFSRLFKKSTGKSVSKYLSDLQDLSGN
ncbi:AraC family transcriptional regulator [Abyssalbus ytuae]|uniref:AraC family transcriptional regulator n=1 Tax=Abyssalbus ytuae TaxID=2926907 RepID=A0A9E6ZPJ4_9FLAO|nr:AraC family transcriptional regulator [Abyssalbus ytuae]UOB18155.1 AraC family transcriptional regulator [Abyssalbus ytuae]